MNVVIINKSDLIGGAAVVSFRLMNALRDAGVDARMLVIDKVSDADVCSVFSVKNKFLDKALFFLERLGIFLHNGRSRENLFKVSTASWGRNIANHPWLKQADVIALNWINQGMLSINGIKSIASLGKPVIWTMHDMWECTGICHHAFECLRFMSDCGCCPFLSSKNPRDLAFKVQSRKRALYNSTNFHFVPVSNWLAVRCRESSLLADKPISVIHNAFPVDKFDFSRSKDSFHGIPAHKKVIVMGAARLDDPIKGFEYLIEALRIIASERHNLASKLHLLLFGSIRNHSLLDKIAIPHTFIGRISGIDKLADIYSHADIVVSTSLYETLPGTLIEGQAAGCLPVTFGYGGQPDIVEHLVNGYIADYKKPRSIADGIDWAANAHIDRLSLHESVRNKFSAAKIADDYIALFNKLTNS